MKFKLVDQDSGGANFTSLQGYLTATRRQLVEVFGEPLPTESLDGKTTTEWIIRFKDKKVTTFATIYDWKRYELGAPTDDEVYMWHIGGHSYHGLELVERAWDKATTVTI